MNTLTVHHLGLIGYGDALAIQRQIHAEVVTGRYPSSLLMLQHLPVITFGKHANQTTNLLVPRGYLESRGVEVFETDRGGEVTAHEPGQLVVYPIVNLREFRLTAREYVSLLEKSVIELLEGLNITAGTDTRHPGVWCGNAKVCAIGVRIKDRATMHGLALNVANNFETFSFVIPCGIQGRGVTNVARLLGRNPGMDGIADRLSGIIGNRLGASIARTEIPEFLRNFAAGTMMTLNPDVQTDSQ